MRTLILSLTAAVAACAGAGAQDTAAAPDPASESPAPDLGLRPDAPDDAADAGVSEGPAAAPPSLSQAVEADLDEVLPRVDAYLAELDVLTGSFYQIEPTGEMSQGRFWIDRPGRMRFEYADPHPFTLVADGATYTVWDRELEDVNTQVPLRETPLNMFLRRDARIGRDAEVVGAWRRDGELWLTLEDTDERVEGMLTLVFAEPALELRRFVTTDSEGGQTEILLSETQRGGRVDPALFVVNEPRRRRR